MRRTVGLLLVATTLLGCANGIPFLKPKDTIETPRAQAIQLYGDLREMRGAIVPPVTAACQAAKLDADTCGKLRTTKLLADQVIGQLQTAVQNPQAQLDLVAVGQAVQLLVSIAGAAASAGLIPAVPLAPPAGLLPVP